MVVGGLGGFGLGVFANVLLLIIGMYELKLRCCRAMLLLLLTTRAADLQSLLANSVRALVHITILT